MTCLTMADIARALASEELPAHVETCLDCRRELEHQQTMRAQLRALVGPRLSEARRRAIKAETMATIHVSRKPRLAGATAIGLSAAAAAIALVWLGRAQPEPRAPDIQLASTEGTAAPIRIVAFEEAPPMRSAPVIDALPGAILTHSPGMTRDIVQLAEGTLEIDTRGTREVDIRIGRTIVRVDDASVRVHAHQHALTKIDVIIGVAQVIGPDAHVTLDRGVVWTAQPREQPVALASFREAWVALRAGNNRDAITLFDRATDPSVAEEASYWAAVAARRAGDLADAKQRYSDFLARFPSSPYADQARRALRSR